MRERERKKEKERSCYDWIFNWFCRLHILCFESFLASSLSLLHSFIFFFLFFSLSHILYLSLVSLETSSMLFCMMPFMFILTRSHCSSIDFNLNPKVSIFFTDSSIKKRHLDARDEPWPAQFCCEVDFTPLLCFTSDWGGKEIGLVKLGSGDYSSNPLRDGSKLWYVKQEFETTWEGKQPLWRL